MNASLRHLAFSAALLLTPLAATATGTQVCLSNCVSLKQPAKRVIALNWSAAEMLLSLEVVPVGVTLTKGYKKWQTNHPAMPDSVTEIGRRQEPDLATIARLKPDLIIGYEFRHRRILDALEQIAPTLLYQQFPSAEQTDFSYFEQSQKVFSGIAQLLDKSALAEIKLQHLHQRLSQLKQQLASNGLANKPVAYAKFVGMGYGLRVFTNKSLAGAISQQLGLNYVWQHGLPGKDFTHLQLEQLPKLNNSHLLLAGNQVDGERMMHSPVWPLLPFVQQHQFSDVAPLFSFGGPLSSIKMAESFAQSLLLWQEQQGG
ncbi:iron-siderophore ABC transporter substrate-binding protein [Agarivorans aestuarii]|uniref:Iron-siderophore ABC transporter substrate-binding protein n=1 Tax=Agarivorans aestuarii TaxID=1563703 RepID=A0ABU7G296_9ALTE|nr:iron-siderophore ABC transporter substrate-binding protein [Agarivorans aestuarii]MEE1673513.1 iron-siderophore ABC transporter substrate-binding protein [Agarivorans aestuarii]